MDLRDVVGEKGDEGRDAAQLPRFGLDRVIHEAEMLEVRGGIGLDDRVGVREEFDDLVKVGVAPADARHAG